MPYSNLPIIPQTKNPRMWGLQYLMTCYSPFSSVLVIFFRHTSHILFFPSLIKYRYPFSLFIPSSNTLSGEAYIRIEKSNILELVITNTIAKTHNSLKVREVSTASFLANTIKAVVANESISLTWKSNNK